AFLNGRSVRHDEIRLGETWASVVPNPSVPPVAPQITGQPLPASNFEGGSVRLAAAISGTPAPALQWFHGAAALANQTGPELILTNLKTADAGDYKLVVTNSAGAVTSNTVTVTVLARPTGLMAYEGFDYPAGAESDGQSGGGGWSGPWQTVDNGGYDLVAGSLAAGGNAPAGYDGLSQGNHSRLISGRRGGRLLDTGAGGTFDSRGFIDFNGNIGADGKTLYLSFLQQPVNFYVVRIDFKDGNDDILVYRNPTGASEPVTADLALPDQADMSFNGISFGDFVGGFAVSHDEIRMGETWASVTVPSGTSPFTQWISGFTFAPGADQSEAGDPDGDGVVNLLEYAFATAPNVHSTAPLSYTGNTVTVRGLPLVTGAPGSLSSVFIRRKDAATTGLSYTAEFSADLKLWHFVAAPLQVVASDAETAAVQTAWPATVPTSGGTAQPARFFRVKVQF
ncbi:MAG: hypothetical protein EOP86_27135, partial [Verrucomicrobiaceae bacterium]